MSKARSSPACWSGLIESFTTQYLDPGLIDIVVFGLLLLMLAFRPTGLISERREENV